MKQISIVAAIVLLLVAAMFFMRDKSARAELDKSGKQVATPSNEVSKLNTIIVMHGSTNSELKGDLAKAAERTTGFSNRLAKASEELKQAARNLKPSRPISKRNPERQPTVTCGSPNLKPKAVRRAR